MGFFTSGLTAGFPAMGAEGAETAVADGALYDARMLSKAEKRIAFSSLALGDGMGLTGLGSAVLDWSICQIFIIYKILNFI
jgi:hypothetical protein